MARGCRSVTQGSTLVCFRWSIRFALVVRIALAIWSFYVPTITKSGFHTLAWILTGFLVISALLGLFFAPSNAGKTLEELHPQRRGRRFTREPAHEPVTS